MPGDKIIREGERGTEMFFIQEGVAEMFIKKTTGNYRQPETVKVKYEKIFLERGSYFGEVHLITRIHYSIILTGRLDVKFKKKC